MPKRDYYDILGVAKTASADDIKKAYRKLARQFHPDVNKSPEAPARFNEIQEAYDVLADEQKRKAYDQFGHAGPGFAGAGAGGPAGARPHYSWTNVGGGTTQGVDFDMDDVGSVFEAFFGERGRAGGGMGGGFGGMGGMGGGARPGKAQRARKASPAREPQAIEHDLDITFMTAAKGGTESLRLQQPDGRTRTLDVRIPKGSADGAKLRVRGGADGADIILRLKVGPHPIFRRSEYPGGPQGLDLYLDLPLTIAEATLGAAVSVPTLDGSVEMRIPPGTASGMKLRARGQGIEDERGTRGDLYVAIKIVPPSAKPSEEEAAVLRRISEKSPDPRAGWKV